MDKEERTTKNGTMNKKEDRINNRNEFINHVE